MNRGTPDHLGFVQKRCPRCGDWFEVRQAGHQRCSDCALKDEAESMQVLPVEAVRTQGYQAVAARAPAITCSCSCLALRNARQVTAVAYHLAGISLAPKFSAAASRLFGLRPKPRLRREARTVAEVICVMRHSDFNPLRGDPSAQARAADHEKVTGMWNEPTEEVLKKGVRAMSQRCNECGRSVRLGSGWFVNRVADLNEADERRRMGKRFPEGGFICAECDARRRVR